VLARLAGPARVVLLVAVLCFAVYALVTSWDEVKESLAAVGWTGLVGSGLVLLVSTWAQFMGWRRCLDALGAPRIRLWPSSAIFFASQAAKYVPGSVWPVLIQSDMGRRYAVPRRSMLASYAYTLLQSLSVAGVLAGLTLLGPAAGWSRLATAGAVVGGLTLLVALRFPHHFHNLLDMAFRRFTGEGMPAGVDRHPLARGRLWVAAGWLLSGVSTWVLAAPLGAGLADLPFVIGASALAWVVGLAVVILPAGAGVREVLLVLTLGQLIGTAEALTVAVISRFLQVVIDLLLAVAAGLPYATRLRREARRAGDDGAPAGPPPP
jgi:uncharacterized membrane protein YbhN (UPF0104 family)